jgi:hypothetical protein
MKIRFYSEVLNLTSRLLNICVKAELWGFAKSLMEFRKNHISKILRKELKINL